MKREVFVIESGSMIQDGTTVFADLTLRLFVGEIAGLAFGNLMEQRYFLELLKGDVILSTGRICLEEKKETFAAAAKKLSGYTAVIGRKSSLISSVSIEDNIFLFSDKRFFISQKDYKKKFMKLKEQFGMPDSLSDRTKELSVKDRVTIELLKAYVSKKKIVVLEDVIGALTRLEADALFAFMEQLKTDMTFLVIAGFEEVGISHLERMVFVRNGSIIAMPRLMLQKKGLNTIMKVLLNESKKPHSVMAQMSGQDKEAKHNTIRVENVSTDYLKDFKLEIKSSEIQKIYYSDEQTGNHIWGIFSGEAKRLSGEIYMGQKSFRAANMAQAIRQGIGFILEKPYRNELIENFTAIENISMPLQEKVKGYWMFRKYTQSVAEYIEERHLAHKKVKGMSSLQRQKMVYEKWLLYMPKLLVCLNPFADIDMNMQAMTVEMMRVLQRRGISILVLTSSLYTINKIPGTTTYYHDGQRMEEEDIWKILYE